MPLLRRDATPAADIVAATGERLMATNACDLPTERLRRPRVELNVANSARLTAGRAPDRRPRRRDGPPPGVPDEELARRLDWATATAL